MKFVKLYLKKMKPESLDFITLRLIHIHRTYSNGMTSFVIFTFIGLVSFSGIAINAYIILVVIKEKQVNTVNGMLLIQTAAVELALSTFVIVCSIPPIITDGGHQLHSSSIAYCTICGFFVSFLRSVALWSVCGLNCDRYYAISAPLHYGSLINSRKVLIAMSVTWISSLILALPALFAGGSYKYDDASFFCTPDFNKTFAVCYSFIYTTLVFIVPLILILTCNMKVFNIARYHKHRIASAIFEVTLSAQVTITHQKNPFARSILASRFRGRRAAMAVFQLVGSFLILYVPYYSLQLWNSAFRLLASNDSGDSINNRRYNSRTSYLDEHVSDTSSDISSYMVSVASVLLFCSSSVNGILYGVKNQVLKNSFRNYWRKKMTKNELNQEIQARTPSTCGSRRPSLTPAIGVGFFALKQPLLRRPSDAASVDTQKSNLLVAAYPTTSTRFQSGNFVWRPGSTPGLESSVFRDDSSFGELKRTLSLRRSSGGTSNRSTSLSNLKLPIVSISSPTKSDDIKKSIETTKNNVDSTSMTSIGGSTHNVALLLHRFRKSTMSREYEALSVKPRRKSPKILITRAFSEENDGVIHHLDVPKMSKSVTTLSIDTNNWNSMAGDSNHAFIIDDSDDEEIDDCNEKRTALVNPNNDDNFDTDSDIEKSSENLTTVSSLLPCPNVTPSSYFVKRKNIKFKLTTTNLSNSKESTSRFDYAMDNVDGS